MTSQLLVSFPASDGDGPMSQDRKWCRVRLDERERTIRFHDYSEIYAVPGLYEEIFHRHLECRSPAEVVGLLAEELDRVGEDPAALSAIDVGAGNGLVGEELRAIGIPTLASRTATGSGPQVSRRGFVGADDHDHNRTARGPRGARRRWRLLMAVRNRRLSLVVLLVTAAAALSAVPEGPTRATTS